MARRWPQKLMERLKLMKINLSY